MMGQLRLWALAAMLSAISLPARSQEVSRAEAQKILSQASHLVPDVPEFQRMSVASNIANAQARAGDLAGALSTVYLLKKPQDQAQALGSVAHFVDYSGDLAGALKMMESAAKGQTRDASYAQIAWAHAHKGEVTGALRVAHLIQNDHHCLIEALDGIAAEQWKSGDHSGAQQSWGEARNVAEHRSEDDPDVRFLLSGIAGSHAQAGDMVGSLQLLHELRQQVEQHHFPDEGLLSIVASGLIQAGEITEALDIINSLPPGSNRDIALMSVSVQLMKKDDVADAEEMASRIADRQLKANAFQEIAAAQAEANRPVSALETLDNIPDLTGRAEALASLALEEAEHDDSAASDTLHRALAAANGAAPKPPNHVFATIAVTEAMLGDFDAAEGILRPLSSDARAWAWWNIAAMMVSAGHLNRALAIAAHEKDAHSKAYALLGSANAILDQLPKKTETAAK